MKNLLFFTIVLMLSTACSIQTKAKDGADGKDGRNAYSGISKVSIQRNLEYLASDELEGRNTGTPGIEKAAVYIEDFFKNNDIKPYFETYRDNFQFEAKTKEGDSIVNKIFNGFNVVGYLEGNDPKLKDQFVILGAHYDHIGKGQEVNGDTIANGANDDASGTVAVMEWAKYFAEIKSNKRSILFTLYSAEEMGLKGSEHLAKRLKEANLNLYTMLNIEMIGVPRAKEHTLAYMSGFERSNFPQELNKHAKEKIIGFFPKSKQYQLFFRSDNYPFYKEFNVPAHAISTFDFTNYDYYHHVDDEVDKMDLDHITNFTVKMAKALECIINSENKTIVLNKTDE